MNLSRLLFLPAAVLALLLASCRGSEADAPALRGEREVCIGLPETRTALDDDGLATRWQKGDRFALWALAADGSATFAGATFSYFGSKGGSAALFRGMVPAMADGTYAYYAASPTPDAVDGLRVSYDVPALQDGEWHGERDILLASAGGPQLEPASADPAAPDVNALDLRFRHRIHALKVTIPAGRNRFGRPVTRLRVQFSVPVAGRLTWDLAAADAAPAITGGSDAVELAFARPKGEGDTFWVYVAPCDLRGAVVRFTATDGTEFSWPVETSAFGDCPAGEITPVTLTIPERRPVTDYRLTVDPVLLGEPVTEIDAIELPEGYSFPSLDLALTRAENLPANDDGTFSLRMFRDMAGDFPAEVGLTVGSAHAAGVVGRLGTGQCVVSGVTPTGCRIRAPYLFYEDFGQVDAHSVESAAVLSDWGLINWSGARAETLANTCITANCHVSTHSGITNSRSRGRVDTSRLPIRSGATLNLSVSFDMGYDTRTGAAGTGAGNSSATCTFGRTDTNDAAVAINADTGFSHTVFSDRAVSSLSGADNLPDKLTGQRVTGCSSLSRLSWQVHTEKRSWGATTTNVTYRCHIDNIRATIVP